MKYFQIMYVLLMLGSKAFQYAWDSRFKIKSKNSIAKLRIIG